MHEKSEFNHFKITLKHVLRGCWVTCRNRNITKRSLSFPSFARSKLKVSMKTTLEILLHQGEKLSSLTLF